MKLHAALSHLVLFSQKGQYVGIRLPRILEADGIGEVTVQGANVPAGEHTVDLKVDALPPGSYHYALEVKGRPVAHHNLLVQ